MQQHTDCSHNKSRFMKNWFGLILVTSLCLMVISCGGYPDPAEVDAYDVYRSNFEMRIPNESDDGNGFWVYICRECTYEQFIEIEIPSPYVKGDARINLVDEIVLVPPAVPDETAARLDFTPDVDGDTFQYVAEVLERDRVSLNPLLFTAKVKRDNTFRFYDGRVVHELTDPDGNRYILFTVEIGIAEEYDLAEVDALSHIRLPSGWSYSSRELTGELFIDTGGVATVVATWGLTWQQY